MTGKATIQASPPWRFRLILITVAGIAAIAWLLIASAVSRHEDARQRAVLLSDLDRLVTMQESHRSATGRYATAIGRGTADSLLDFRPSAGVQLTFEPQGPLAWRAVATDPRLEVAPTRCGVFQGDVAVSPHRAVTTAGVPACW
jgi:hypothetical protein